MRGLAALGVVVNHSRGNLFSTADQYAQEILPKANWGLLEWLNILAIQQTNVSAEFVILFFVLSGFSIAHSLDTGFSIKSFYFKRFIRLYPTYILGIIWALIVFWLIGLLAPEVYYKTTEGRAPFISAFQHFTTLKTMLRNLLYDPVDNALTTQYWSLPFELVFYLIAPFIIRKLKWAGLASVLLFTIGCAFFGINHFNSDGNSLLANFFFNFNIYFVLGIVLYRYKDSIIQRFPLNKWTSLIALLVLFEVVVFTKAYLFHQVYNKMTAGLMGVFAVIMLISGLKFNVRLKPLEWVGKFSYTLYATHLATIYLLKIWAFRHGFHFYLIPYPYLWLAGVAAAVVVGYCTYFLAEYPSSQYISALRRRQKSEMPVVKEHSENTMKSIAQPYNLKRHDTRIVGECLNLKG